MAETSGSGNHSELKSRFLKISGALRASTSRTNPHDLRETPLLRMVGRWLEEAGFPIGQRVEVRVFPGRLEVTAEEGDPGRARDS